MDKNRGDSSTETMTVQAYSGALLGAGWTANFVFSYGWSDISSQRVMQIGTQSFHAASDTDSKQWSATARVSKSFRIINNHAALVPFIQLQYGRSKIAAYQEDGAGNLGLVIDEQSNNVSTGQIGFRASYAMRQNWGSLIPHFRLAYDQRFNSETRNVKTNFIDDTGASFQTTIDETDKNSLNAGASLTAIVGKDRMFGLSYDGVFANENYEMHSLAIHFRMRF